MRKLFEEKFDIETSKKHYKVKYISTNWAKGFNCTPSTCGLCCISELPPNVPKKNFKPFDEVICRYFNVENKKCEMYDKRPLGCKLYPFIFGFENEDIIVSPSLECPSTNASILNINSLKETFNKPSFGLVIDNLNQVLKEAKYSRFWDTPQAYWAFLEDQINKYFDQKNQFPILEDLSDQVQEWQDNYFNVKTNRTKLTPIYQLIKNIANGKSVILGGFSTKDITMIYFKIKKFKVHSTIWNPAQNSIKKVKSRLPIKSLNLKITEDGMKILRDYLSLIFKRPFLSLSAVQLTKAPRMVPLLMSSNFVGAITHIEVAANLLAYRFTENVIDREGMRDILSFADGCLLSMFGNPQKSMRF